MNWIGTGLNAVGGAVSLATGNAYGAAKFGSGLTGGIAKNIASNMQAERNIEEKLDTLKVQATSVSNCDDVDLLEAYSNNKAKLKTYKVDNRTKEELFDLFYYEGYKTNVHKVPNIDNRYWFNYVKCDPVFKSTGMIYNRFIDDVKMRYNNGVTVYHHHGDWDWNQDRENWESFIA